MEEISLEEAKAEGVREYISRTRTEAVEKRWAGMPVFADRKAMVAVATYARKLKNEGKEEADRWVVERFGEERGSELLASVPFRRQYIRSL